MPNRIKDKLYVCDYEFKVGSVNMILCIYPDILNCMGADIELVIELDLTRIVIFAKLSIKKQKRTKALKV